MSDAELPTLPANLPDIDTAPLPVKYERARDALAECDRIDECKNWSDKMQALASYAKQSHDKELENMARRIRARAIRQCGLLLKAYDARGENRRERRPEERNAGGGTFSSATEAARHAGLSHRQQANAARLANIPDDQFERAVESDDPPTVTRLAAKTRREPEPPVHLGKATPQEFHQSTLLGGLVAELLRSRKRVNISQALRGFTDRELDQLAEDVDEAIRWLRKVEDAIDAM